MGNTAVKAIAPAELDIDICIIKSSKQFTILSIQDPTNLLEYDDDEIMGESITILMTDIVKKMHIPIFEKIKKQNILEIKRKIKVVMDNIRTMQIVTKTGLIKECYVDIELNSNFTSVCTLREVKTKNDSTCPRQYLQYINGKNEYHIDTFQNVVCVLMDVGNSTEFSIKRSSEEVSLLYFNIMKILDKILKHFLPYIYIHETTGDAIFILINTPFVRRHQHPCRLAMEFCKLAITDIHIFLKKYKTLYMRCGISYGEISAGVIDGRSFRVFGSIVNKASRLESICKKDYIEVEEHIYTSLEITTGIQNTNDLKGFGNVKSYSINIEDI